MTADKYSLFPCELCCKNEFAEIPEVLIYTSNQPIHVCKNCGFVQVIRRRPPERIAEVWAKELYQADYTARIPAVKARHVYVAETIDVAINLRGKKVCDIGAGEGYFVQLLRDQYGATVFGVEPSQNNCDRMRQNGIACFDGTAEQYISSPLAEKSFDVVTIIWTLENSNSCRQLMNAAWNLLRDDGHVILATGSRLLVPFKKPLGTYLGRNPTDTHAFRFSANTLQGLLAESGFVCKEVNHYIDSDVLCMIGRRTGRQSAIPWQRDDWKNVLDFFSRWHKESLFYCES